MDLFSDRFMAALVRSVDLAAAEPDERARERQMAAAAANILARLATSELLDNDDQRQVALLAVRLMVSLQLAIE